MNKIFVDCSYLSAHTELNTGIQRVVRRIIENLDKLSKEYEVGVIPVNIAHGKFEKIDFEALYPQPKPDTKEEKPKELKQSFKVKVKNYLFNLYNALRMLVISLLPLDSVRKFMDNPRDQFGFNAIVYSITIKPIRAIRRLFSKNQVTLGTNPDIDTDLIIEKDDILLLIDSSWYMDIWPTVAFFKQSGGRVNAVTYDLIPITHDQFCDAFLVEVFKEWFYDSLEYVDGYIAISNTVQVDLEKFLNQ